MSTEAHALAEGVLVTLIRPMGAASPEPQDAMDAAKAAGRGAIRWG